VTWKMATMDESQQIKKLVRTNTIHAFDAVCGHTKSFYTDSDGIILKKNSRAGDGISEAEIMKKLMSDVLHVCIPTYYGISNLNGVEFIKMEHLTSTNNEMSIMDVKLGSKTYLKIEENNKLRADLYQKMIKVDETAPTEIEMKRETISKLRYLDFRDCRSTSRKLCFRVEGIRLTTGEQLEKEYLNRIGTSEEVISLLHLFVTSIQKEIDPQEVCFQIIQKLKNIRDIANQSIFFKNYKFVGTSLLFIVEADRIDVKLIDFAKVRANSESNAIDTDTPNPTESHSNNDDWLTGIDNLISSFQSSSILN